MLPTTMGRRTVATSYNGTQDRCYQPQWDPGQVLPTTFGPRTGATNHNGTQDRCFLSNWDSGKISLTKVGWRTDSTCQSGTCGWMPITDATKLDWSGDIKDMYNHWDATTYSYRLGRATELWCAYSLPTNPPLQLKVRWEEGCDGAYPPRTGDPWGWGGKRGVMGLILHGQVTRGGLVGRGMWCGLSSTDRWPKLLLPTDREGN